MSNYKVTDKVTPGGFKIIRLTDGKFEGIEYSYSRVAFEERDDDLALIFDYNIESGEVLSPPVAEEFGQHIGKILTKILQEQASQSEVVYYGGK